MALQRDLCNITLLAMFVISSLDASFGVQYMVGESFWSIPPDPNFYTNWSSSIIFYIGDSLVFDFESEFFNVIQVPRPDYESCTTGNPMKILTVSPATVTLMEDGVFYYICNISNYCDLGQKISIIVGNHYSSPSPSPLPLPLPLPSSSPSLPPFAPSFGPFSAPDPSQRGWDNGLPQSPVAGGSTAPLMPVISGNSCENSGGNRRSFGVFSDGIWANCALCLGLLFDFFVSV